MSPWCFFVEDQFFLFLIHFLYFALVASVHKRDILHLMCELRGLGPSLIIYHLLNLISSVDLFNPGFKFSNSSLLLLLLLAVRLLLDVGSLQ